MQIIKAKDSKELIMNQIKAIKTNDNNQSCSRAKQFIGVPVVGKDGKLLNGEYRFKFENEEEENII